MLLYNIKRQYNYFNRVVNNFDNNDCLSIFKTFNDYNSLPSYKYIFIFYNSPSFCINLFILTMTLSYLQFCYYYMVITNNIFFNYFNNISISISDFKLVTLYNYYIYINYSKQHCRLLL